MTGSGPGPGLPPAFVHWAGQRRTIGCETSPYIWVAEMAGASFFKGYMDMAKADCIVV